MSYQDLAIPTLINTAGRYTALGGSVMAPEVVRAMVAASQQHVQMIQLHTAVGAELARLTGNEAAHVTSGAAAGLALAVMACRTGNDQAAVAGLARQQGRAAEVIVQRTQAIPYLPAITLAGARVIEAGTPTAVSSDDLTKAFSDRTVAILFVAGSHLERGAQELSAVVEIGRRRSVPVIVDAAAQLPPAANLWRFTRELGADLAVFSGGKDLRGPQSSGLVVGRRALVSAIAAHASPHQQLGRAFKVGKEEIMGLLAAVSRYLAQDEHQRRAEWQRTLRQWQLQLCSIDDIEVVRVESNEAGQPIPRLIVRLTGVDRDAAALRSRMLAGVPPVAVAAVQPDAIGLTPECLLDGQSDAVVPALLQALATAAGPAGRVAT